jgi:cysteine sulfinate desulfinase/cysteine desulfurase-like protein
MGIDPELAHGSLRLTLGRGTTADEIRTTIRTVQEVVGRLRAAGGQQPAREPAAVSAVPSA